MTKDFKEFNVKTRKFDQSKEVRNLNILYNKDNFLNKTILQIVRRNNIVDDEHLEFFIQNNRINQILNQKVKNHFHFNFLKSSTFNNWIKDPLKIYQSVI